MIAGERGILVEVHPREQSRTVQRFALGDLLGAGGMGAVFRARDPQLERDVAIKVLAGAAATSSELSTERTLDLRTDAPASPESLLAEARIMAKLSHPNVLPIYEVGLADGLVFLVMEYIDGCDLAAWLDERREPAQILDVFAQAGRGLAAAHAIGIVHRDFKPNNVLIGRDGRVRVADFGLSRLTALPNSTMRRVERAGGTPRYMAPELSQGQPATAKSDVFAYALALAEALGGRRDALERTLRERGVTSALRIAIAAGLSADPDRRPNLETFLIAIEGRSSFRRSWIAGAAVALLGTGAILAVTLSRSDGPACDLAPDLGTTWNDARRAAVRTALARSATTPAAHAMVDKIVATFDEGKRAIDERWRATCEARRDGKLTEEQAAASRSCVERRAFELEHKIERLPKFTKVSLAERLVNAHIAHVRDCAATTAPASRDRAAVGTLYRRIVDVSELPEAAKLEAFESIATDARMLGEREAEAHTLLAIGKLNAWGGQLAVAEDKLGLAYRIGLELQAPDLQAQALSWRIRNAERRGDSREALSLGKLALDLVAHSDVSVATHAKLLAVLGHAAFEKGELDQALKTIDEGLALVAKDGHRLAKVELAFRVDRYNTLAVMEGRHEQALAVARENVEWTRTMLGEDNDEYVTVLNLLGGSLMDAGDLKGALVYKQQAMDAIAKIYPPGHPSVESLRIDFAQALKALGRYEEARAELVKIMTAMEHSEPLHTLRPLITARMGEITCEVGRCKEGLPLLERAIELGAAQYGTDHPYTQGYRLTLLRFQLELERYDDAERTIAALDRNYRSSKDAHVLRLAHLHGVYSADLATSRGNPKQAEQHARDALAVFVGENADDLVRMQLLATLGVAFVAQKRWADARKPLEDSIAIARGKGAYSAFIAEVEIKLAHVEAALGDTTVAGERATRAREVLVASPMALRSRKAADALLARVGSKDPVQTRPE